MTKLRMGDIASAYDDVGEAPKSDSLAGTALFNRSQAYRALAEYARSLDDARAAARRGR